MTELTNMKRRSFLNTAALGLAASQIGYAGGAFAATVAPASTFPAIRQINAGLLDVGYVDMGPSDGMPILLLHGWPYDIHAFVDVAPVLVAAGYRVIIPHLRGYGSTRFLSANTCLLYTSPSPRDRG